MFEKIKNKIRAIFSVNGNGVVMDLHSAEIKQGQAYLHPEDNEEITYVVKSSLIDILINDGADIPEEDVRIIERTKSDIPIDKIDKDILPINKKKNTPNDTNIRTKNSYKTKVVFTVYEDGKEFLDSIIKNSGINRSDFLMACLQNSQKKSVHKSFAAECARVKKARYIRQKALKEQMNIAG